MVRILFYVLALINLGYIAWTIYLIQLIQGDKIYVVILFWTLIIIVINLFVAGLLKLIYKMNSKVLMWICLFEVLGLITLPFLS